MVKSELCQLGDQLSEIWQARRMPKIIQFLTRKVIVKGQFLSVRHFLYFFGYKCACRDAIAYFATFRNFGAEEREFEMINLVKNRGGLVYSAVSNFSRKSKGWMNMAVEYEYEYECGLGMCMCPAGWTWAVCFQKLVCLVYFYFRLFYSLFVLLYHTNEYLFK